MENNELFKFNTSINNILIVEDSTSIIGMINNIFVTLGFKTFLSTTLKEARDVVSRNKIDYLILDINLPDGSGYELIKELHTQKASTKIVVITTQIDSQLKEASYLHGILDFINKDKNFLYKISEIPKLIKQIEKNKTKTVLIVDNSSVVREQLKDILFSRNYNILEAKNEKEAISIISKSKIDLMLLDLKLEISNGYDFLLKNRDLIFKQLNIKVIVITENMTSTLLHDAYRLGVRDVLKKPYLIEELILKTDMFMNDKDIEDEVVDKTQLLNQYKDTVDRSSIVSKTNPKGIITYVNDAFCEISGYSKEELIGKSHNIIRHHDMESSVFKEMWHTIKILKQPWRGIVKNRRKDGMSYWVQTIMNPIVDSKGKIVEFIGIRTDITHVEQTKEDLKKLYDISQINFEEIVNLSKLYENAIEQTNIILRVNKEKIITYANEKFYKISGFTKEELIGKPYNFLKRTEKINDLYINTMWNQISKGNIWKGRISNTFKDKKTYHFLATVVPIINKNGHILEYMGIRKDITAVIELQEEIEETQKELIYKMGNIGESRSNETGNHVKRVAEYSRVLAKLSGIGEKEAEILFMASPMHDIGKVGVPDAILNKPGKLTDDEWKIMKKHSITGYNLLKNSNRDIIKTAAIVARDHHEKWDGTGYPRRIKGEDIHIYGRITAIADVFDALGSERVYKKAWRDEDIFNLLKEQSGKHFDPKLINLFFENLERFIEIRNKYKDQ